MMQTILELVAFVVMIPIVVNAFRTAWNATPESNKMIMVICSAAASCRNMDCSCRVPHRYHALKESIVKVKQKEKKGRSSYRDCPHSSAKVRCEVTR